MTLAPRRGVSIFARTFGLLLAALLVAQAIGLALLLTRTPLRDPGFTLAEVVALLSSRTPSTDARLTVADSPSPPPLPEKEGYYDDRGMSWILAEWLNIDPAQIRYYTTEPGPPLPAHPDDIDLQPHGPWKSPDGRGPGPGGMRGRLPHDDAATAPSPADADAPANAPRTPDGQPSFPRPGPGGGPGVGGPRFHLQADSVLRGDFIAAMRAADGHWRVVEHRTAPGAAGVRTQVLLLFGLGALAMLPMAWWFSRALAAPIRRFSQAADRLGRNPDEPPLSREGPAELAQAIDSFNAMQARINRLLKERTETVGAIAHDLRTPLARLRFRLDALPPEQRDKADADIAEMSSMIAAALDFLRDQSHAGSRERLDFGLLVESVVDDMADLSKDVTLAGPVSAVLVGDPLGLRRMVANLVDNALKYGRRARLKLLREGGNWVLWVDDDGPGIDPAKREQLLLPFVRGESSRNRDTGGIGLGLSVAHGVALAHGGTIELDNRPEGGLRVSVRLPCEG